MEDLYISANFHPEWDTISDEELIRQMHASEDKAEEIIDYLLERYKNLVRIKTRPFFIIGADRADMIQEGMIGLYTAIIKYNVEKDCSFATFAGGVISKHIIDAVKASTRLKNIPLNSYVSFDTQINDDGEKEMTLEEALVSPDQSPEDYIIDRESASLLQKSIDENLSRFEKKVLSCYIHGYDYHKIADLLNKTPKSIDNALQRIKKKVSGLIERID